MSIFSSRFRITVHIFYSCLFMFSGMVSGNNSADISIPVFSADIELDGVLDEPAWERAAKIVDFYTFQPVDGLPANERTAALLGYDEENLYVALICFYEDPSKIRASICKRDDIFEDDFIIFYLDTFSDGKNAYQFAFNPYGIQADGIFTDHVGEDFNPDFIFNSKGRIFQKGYIVEAAIPFKSLRFDQESPNPWRLAFLRRTQYLNHDVVWPKISLNSTEFVGQFGRLSNISNIQSVSRFEILPEIAGLQQGQRNSDNERFDEGPVEGEIGVNLKLGVSSGLTLDLTANPDFSQIEADANKIDVNRRFPLYYDEKRPFFLEGTEIFQTPIEVVYTRKMVDPLAGIKFSGRSGPYSIGLLSEIDRYEGSMDYLTGMYYSDDIIDTYRNEKTFNNIIRIKRDILDNSFIGLIATDREFGDSYNRVFGLDGSFAFLNNYHISMQTLYSQTRTVEKEKKEDPALVVNFYHGTRKLKIQAYYQDIDTNFVAANGFIQRTDIREGGTRIWYDLQRTDHLLQHFQPRVDYYRIYDHRQDLVEEEINPSLNFNFRSKNDLYLNYYYQLEEYVGTTFYKNSYSIYLINSYIPWLYGNIYWYTGDEIFYSALYAGLNPELGTTQYLSSDLTIKPGKAFTTTMSATAYRFTTERYDFDYTLNQNIYRLKSTWQISRSLSLRLIYELIDNREDPALLRSLFDMNDNADFNFLVSWQPSPGTVFFLGMNDYQKYEKPYAKGWLFQNFRRQQRGFFVKFSYLFRF